MPHVIRPARLEDVAGFVDYIAQHLAESGRGDTPHFATTRRIAKDELRDAVLSRWSRRLDEPLWGRAWVLAAQEAPRRVLGHLELRGGRVPAELHRAVLAMGMLAEHRGQGLGRKMLEEAIAWARDEALLSWLDLGVFAGNERALRLYRGLGFVEVGLRRDAFRVDDGTAIDDIQMSLPLRDAPAAQRH